MGQYLIDTNVISEYFSASLPVTGMALLDKVINSIPNISIITQIELLCWRTDNITEQKVIKFIKDSLILDINNDIVTHCVDLKRNKKIKTPDAIIAATAISHKLTLITSDTDFNNIPDLEVINP